MEQLQVHNLGCSDLTFATAAGAEPVTSGTTPCSANAFRAMSLPLHAALSLSAGRARAGDCGRGPIDLAFIQWSAELKGRG